MMCDSGRSDDVVSPTPRGPAGPSPGTTPASLLPLPPLYMCMYAYVCVGRGGGKLNSRGYAISSRGQEFSKGPCKTLVHV